MTSERFLEIQISDISREVDGSSSTNVLGHTGCARTHDRQNDDNQAVGGI